MAWCDSSGGWWSASQTPTLPVPRPQLQPGRVEVAVNEDAGPGVGASEGSGGCEGSVAYGFGGALTPVLVPGAGLLGGLLVADEAADVVEGGGV